MFIYCFFLKAANLQRVLFDSQKKEKTEQLG